MSASPKPAKLVVVIALAALMVAIALAVIMNYYGGINAIDEGFEARPDIEVLVPENVTMQRGETKVIPLELRIVSREPLEGRITLFSTESTYSAQQETTSNDGRFDEQFQILTRKGFTDGFRGSLDIESFSSPGNLSGEATVETVSLTLTANDDVSPGSYYFVHSVLGETETWDFLSSGTFEVIIT